MKSGSARLIPVGLILLIVAISLAVTTAGSGNGWWQSYLPLILDDWPLPSPTPLPGRLVISEVLFDPPGQEPAYEWIEIYNAGESEFSLERVKIGDAEIIGDTEGMHQFPSGAKIAAGQVILIANQAMSFKSLYGFAPNYELRETDPQVPNLLKYTAWASGSAILNNPGD